MAMKDGRDSTAQPLLNHGAERQNGRIVGRAAWLLASVSFLLLIVSFHLMVRTSQKRQSVVLSRSVTAEHFQVARQLIIRYGVQTSLSIPLSADTVQV